MPKKDLTQVAFDVFKLATGEAERPAETAKQRAGRIGGSKGGPARSSSLTPERRSAIARAAAKKRWASK